jgi:hypothetical protein
MSVRRADHIAVGKYGSKWKRINADYYPMLHGENARRAGQLVVDGVEATLASGRRTAFHASLGGLTAWLDPRFPEYTTTALAEIREAVGDRGSVFITYCPQETVEHFLQAFRTIAEERNG